MGLEMPPKGYPWGTQVKKSCSPSKIKLDKVSSKCYSLIHHNMERIHTMTTFEVGTIFTKVDKGNVKTYMTCDITGVTEEITKTDMGVIAHSVLLVEYCTNRDFTCDICPEVCVFAYPQE